MISPSVTFSINLKPLNCFAIIIFTWIVSLHLPVLSAYATQCNIGWMSHDGETFSNSTRSYYFSGSCSTQSDGATVRNFSYQANGSWDKISKTASEKVHSDYGNLKRTYQCNYDPWLEPAATCTQISQTWASVPSGYVASHDFPSAFALMNNNKKSPVTASSLDNDYRADKVNQIMAQSLKIIGPEQNQHFDNPKVIVATEMERPVLNPPNNLVVLKVSEDIWPGPDVTPRYYDDAKTFIKTPDTLLTYFNLSGKDLWGARWSATTHVLSNNSIWTPATLFEVGENMIEKIVSTIPQKPIIHSPRPNKTYTTAGGVLIHATFQKDADLHYQVGYRRTGEQEFTMSEEMVRSHENLPHPGTFGPLPMDRIAHLAGEGNSDIKIRAWTSRMIKSQGGLPVTKISEVNEVITRVIVEKLKITSPSENQVFGVPAHIPFLIPNTYATVMQTLEVEMQWIPHNTNLSIPQAFKDYNNGEYTMSYSGGNKSYTINYHCKDIGLYRFRVRLPFSETGGLSNTDVPWTDWKQVKVLGMLGEPVKVDISTLTQKSSMQNLLPNAGIQPVSNINKLKHTKTMVTLPPVLLQPKNEQIITRKGIVQLKANGVDQDEELEWQLEFKNFEKNKYTRLQIRGLRQTTIKNQMRGQFQAIKDGEYRIRARQKTKGSKWGKWTSFSVGKKVLVKKSLPEHSIQLKKTDLKQHQPTQDQENKAKIKKNAPKIEDKPAQQNNFSQKLRIKTK